MAASVDNEEWAQSLVEAGVGLAIVPLHQGTDYSHCFVVKELSEIEGMEPLRRTVGVAIPFSHLAECIAEVKEKLIKAQTEPSQPV